MRKRGNTFREEGRGVEGERGGGGRDASQWPCLGLNITYTLGVTFSSSSFLKATETCANRGGVSRTVAFAVVSRLSSLSLKNRRVLSNRVPSEQGSPHPSSLSKLPLVRGFRSIETHATIKTLGLSNSSLDSPHLAPTDHA